MMLGAIPIETSVQAWKHIHEHKKKKITAHKIKHLLCWKLGKRPGRATCSKWSTLFFVKSAAGQRHPRKKASSIFYFFFTLITKNTLRLLIIYETYTHHGNGKQLPFFSLTNISLFTYGATFLLNQICLSHGNLHIYKYNWPMAAWCMEHGPSQTSMILNTKLEYKRRVYVM